VCSSDLNTYQYPSEEKEKENMKVQASILSLLLASANAQHFFRGSNGDPVERSLSNAGGGMVDLSSTTAPITDIVPTKIPHSMASHSMAPHTMVPHSMAPHSMAPHSMAPHSMAPHSMAPHSMAPHSMAPHSMAPLLKAADTATTIAPHSLAPQITTSPAKAVTTRAAVITAPSVVFEVVTKPPHIKIADIKALLNEEAGIQAPVTAAPVPKPPRTTVAEIKALIAKKAGIGAPVTAAPVAAVSKTNPPDITTVQVKELITKWAGIQAPVTSAPGNKGKVTAVPIFIESPSISSPTV